MNRNITVTIIGGGVSGLTVALRLQQAGYRVTIIAKDFSPYTTASDKAAAFVFAFHVNVIPAERADRWLAESIRCFSHLAENPGSGVVFAPGVIGFEEPTPEPSWHAIVRGFRRPTGSELPSAYTDGFWFQTPVVQMPIFMPYLMRQFASCGGRFVQGHIHNLNDPLLADSDVIVNCSGLGARKLVGDRNMTAVRGQLVRVACPTDGPFTKPFFMLGETPNIGLVYGIRRLTDLIIGGTVEEGREDLEPDPATRTAMIERLALFYPEVATLPVLEDIVGLRPGRTEVRVEAEPYGHRLLVHSYGFGGAGVTLAFGAAAEVLQLVTAYSSTQDLGAAAD